jgi:Nucleotidyl transferase AbiEii toxin, Type IV TA system
MPTPNDQVRAARALLREVCTLLDAYRDDAVLVGGWVPEVLFPDAVPPHVGSVDVDLAMRLDREGYEKVVALLHREGFHQGENGYQFFKPVAIDGRTVTARLDLLTSTRHHEKHFTGSATAPQAVHGADIAFRDQAVVPASAADTAHVRVAGIVAFLVMKSLALAERAKPKDAYDIHFCLEQYPDGLEPLATLFRTWRGDALVDEALKKLAAKFRSEEDDGPRMVADVERVIGDARAIRKLTVYTRVNEFLTLCR